MYLQSYSLGCTSVTITACFQLLDAGLGVEHHDMEGEFLADMRKHYMPPNQV